MSIEWIHQRARVPDTRRKVLTWGAVYFMGGFYKWQFLGVTRYNATKEDGQFDCERRSMLDPFHNVVVFWAEITPPQALVEEEWNDHGL